MEDALERKTTIPVRETEGRGCQGAESVSASVIIAPRGSSVCSSNGWATSPPARKTDGHAQSTGVGCDPSHFPGSAVASHVARVPRRDIKGWGAAVVPKDEPTIIGQKAFQKMPPFESRRVQSRGRFRHASFFCYAIYEPLGVVAEDNHAVTAPRSPRRLIEPKTGIADRALGAARSIDPLQLRIGEKCQRSTVWRPER